MASITEDVLRGCRKRGWIRATVVSVLWAGAAVVLPTTTAFTTTAIPISATTQLLAEKGGDGGAPQYQKYAGILQKSECVGKGSYLLTIDYKNADDDAADAAATDDDFADYPVYEAGNVLALEIQPPSTISSSSSSSSSAGTDAAADEEEAAASMPEKTRRDLATNEGWLRGPYTVSYGYGSTSNNQNKPGFKVLIKDVGYKSHVMATARPGTPVRFGGQFKVPICAGILAASTATASEDDDKEDTATVDDKNLNEENVRREATTRVLMIASGVGVGPCLGATEQLWLAPERAATAVASMEVIASYRTQDEMVTMEMIQTSDVMRQQQPLNVSWKNVITSDREVGRLSSQGPDFLRDNYLRSSSPSSSSSSASRV